MSEKLRERGSWEGGGGTGRPLTLPHLHLCHSPLWPVLALRWLQSASRFLLSRIVTWGTRRLCQALRWVAWKHHALEGFPVVNDPLVEFLWLVGGESQKIWDGLCHWFLCSLEPGIGAALLSTGFCEWLLCKILSLVKEKTDIKRSSHLSYFRVFKVLSHIRTHLISQSAQLGHRRYYLWDRGEDCTSRGHFLVPGTCRVAGRGLDPDCWLFPSGVTI